MRDILRRLLTWLAGDREFDRAREEIDRIHRKVQSRHDHGTRRTGLAAPTNADGERIGPARECRPAPDLGDPGA